MDFRKSLVFLLSLLLLVSNTGLAVSMHYCGDELAAVDTGFGARNLGCSEEAAPCCAAAAADAQREQLSKTSCCVEKAIQLKTATQEVITKQTSVEKMAAVTVTEAIVAPTPFVPVRPIGLSEGYSYAAHGPPLYLLYSSYLFYA